MNVKMEENYNNYDAHESSSKKTSLINSQGEKLIKPNDSKFSEKTSCEKLINDVVQSDVDTAADLSEVEPDVTADAELEVHGDLENDVEYEADVELEADAESLSSCDGSENSSQKNTSEIKYFRFTRKGLSICVPIKLENYTSDVPLVVVDEKGTTTKSQCAMSEESPNTIQEDIVSEINSASTIGCPIIDFQKECYAKYPSWYTVGVTVDKFAKFHDAPLKSSSLAPPKLATPSNLIQTSNETSDRISASNITETNVKINSTGDLNDSTKNRSENDSVQLDGVETVDEPTISNSSFQRDDRLSNVIQDILHRLNRQGTLAVPGDVCRKGGGKSGNYYDKDDDFVDDSLTYAVLGLSPSISHRSTHTAKSDVLGLGDSFYEDPLSASLHDEDDESLLELYDYKTSLSFTCDNVLENDFQLLVNEASDDIIRNTDHQQTNLSQEHSSEDEDDEETSHDGLSQQEETHTKNSRKPSQPFVTKKYWIRRKAWREYESKLNPYLFHVLCRLETILIDKGNRHGLFAPVAEIAPLFREAVQDVFDKEYPHVSWNSSTFVATSYSEGLYAQNSNQNTKELKQEINGYPLPKSTCLTANKDSQMHSNQDSTNHSLENFSKEDMSKNIATCNTITTDPQTSLSESQPNLHETKELLLINSTESCVSHDSLLEDTIKSNVIKQNSQKGAVHSPQTPNVTDARQSVMTEDKNNKTVEKKHRKKCMLEPNFHNTVTLEDIVPLVISPSMKLLGTCLMKVSNIISDDLLKKWLLVRLVLHNQVVYSALEHRLYRYITQKSSLFRTKGSFFFRNLKKAVDAYLKSLATSSEATIKSTSHNKNTSITTPNSCGTPLPSTPLTSSSTHVNGKLPRDKYCKSVSVNSASPSSTISVTNDENITKAVSESPFITIAKELLNWAIVYNCRRHELKEIGETLDEWTVSFPTYAVDILNQSIQKRRNIASMASSSTSSLPASTQAQRKNRIWVPIKFMEKTLAEFKVHFGVLTLNERRGRKTTMPQFILPCKGLDPPVSRACKPSGHPRQNTKKVSTKATKESTKTISSSSSSNTQSNPSGSTQLALLESTQSTALDSIQPTSLESSQSNTPGFNPLSASKLTNSTDRAACQFTFFEPIQSTQVETTQTAILEAHQTVVTGINEPTVSEVVKTTTFASTQPLTSTKIKVTSDLPLKSLSVKKRKRQPSENFHVDAKSVTISEEGDVTQPKTKKNNSNEKISESSKEGARTFNSCVTKGNASALYNKMSASGKMMSLSEYFSNPPHSTDMRKSTTNVLGIVPKDANVTSKSDYSESSLDLVVEKDVTSLLRKEKSPKMSQQSVSLTTPKICAFSNVEKVENTSVKEKASCFTVSKEACKQNNSSDKLSLSIAEFSEKLLPATNTVYTLNSKLSNAPKTEVKTTGTIMKNSSPNCAALTKESSEKPNVSNPSTLDPNAFSLLTHHELPFDREPSKTMAPSTHIPSVATPFHTVRPSFLQQFPLSVPFPLMNTSMTHPNMLNNSTVFPSIPFDTIMMQMNKMYYPLPNSIYSTSNYPWPSDTSVGSTPVRPINPFSSSSTISSDKV